MYAATSELLVHPASVQAVSTNRYCVYGVSSSTSCSRASPEKLHASARLEHVRMYLPRRKQSVYTMKNNG